MQHDSPETLARRITDLEMLFTHLQQTVQDLNEVVLQQGRQLDSLVDRVDRTAASLETLSSEIAERRPIEEEKPPHY